mgnify:FL=1
MKHETDQNSTPTPSSQGHSTRQGMHKELYDFMLENLVELASHPATKAYAWQKAKDREANPYGFFKGITEDLIQIMKQKATK